MNICICDDEPIIVLEVERIIRSKYDSQVSIISINSSFDIVALINNTKNLKIDILIIDIVLKDENGIDLAAYLLSLFPNLKIIFMTSQMQYAQNIFLKVKPYGFLSKPIEPDLLLTHIKEIEKERNEQIKNYSFISKRIEISLNPKDIIYIESQRSKLLVKTVSNTYITYGRLDKEQERLPSGFIRCHKSFLVNIDYIIAVEENSFKLLGGEEVVISRAMSNQAKNTYFRLKGGLAVLK